jgi:hypothetical protein
MYEFDEEGWDNDGWDNQGTEAGDGKGIAEGWLIQRGGHGLPSRISADQPMFLQIGTGQWCTANYATLFPLRRTAVIYAKEFGYVVGRTVRIVKHRF